MAFVVAVVVALLLSLALGVVVGRSIVFNDLIQAVLSQSRVKSVIVDLDRLCRVLHTGGWLQILTLGQRRA